jgi:hypothetical protein
MVQNVQNAERPEHTAPVRLCAFNGLRTIAMVQSKALLRTDYEFATK